jgi:hypothetical protein
MPGVFPDYPTPIVRNSAGGRELALARWGMPSSSKAQLEDPKARRQARGKETTIRLQAASPDGARRLNHEYPERKQRALETLVRYRAPLYRAVHVFQRIQQGCWRRHLVCARRRSFTRLLRRALDDLDVGPEGARRRDYNDLFAFLTTEPNAEVGAVYPKAMPVILTEPKKLMLGWLMLGWLPLGRRR